jgi:hypothetical protein
MTVVVQTTQHLPLDTTALALCRQSGKEVATLARAALYDFGFVAQALFGAHDLAVQVRQVNTTEIAQLNTLEIIPDAFIRVEIGGIAGQLLKVQAFGCPTLEKVFERVRPMDGRAIPDEHDLARASCVRGRARTLPRLPRHRR